MPPRLKGAEKRGIRKKKGERAVGAGRDHCCDVPIFDSKPISELRADNKRRPLNQTRAHGEK